MKIEKDREKEECDRRRKEETPIKKRQTQIDAHIERQRSNVPLNPCQTRAREYCDFDLTLVSDSTACLPSGAREPRCQNVRRVLHTGVSSCVHVHKCDVYSPVYREAVRASVRRPGPNISPVPRAGYDRTVYINDVNTLTFQHVGAAPTCRCHAYRPSVPR